MINLHEMICYSQLLHGVILLLVEHLAYSIYSNIPLILGWFVFLGLLFIMDLKRSNGSLIGFPYVVTNYLLL